MAAVCIRPSKFRLQRKNETYLSASIRPDKSVSVSVVDHELRLLDQGLSVKGDGNTAHVDVAGIRVHLCLSALIGHNNLLQGELFESSLVLFVFCGIGIAQNGLDFCQGLFGRHFFGLVVFLLGLLGFLFLAFGLSLGLTSSLGGGLLFGL